MTKEDVLEVLNALEQAGVSVWIDGAWGVDALVGEETRPHTDLDLALDRARPHCRRGQQERRCRFACCSPVSSEICGSSWTPVDVGGQEPDVPETAAEQAERGSPLKPASKAEGEGFEPSKGLHP
jgi:Aminoglycoside-2''-adenylyltransferase